MADLYALSVWILDIATSSDPLTLMFTLMLRDDVGGENGAGNIGAGNGRLNDFRPMLYTSRISDEVDCLRTCDFGLANCPIYMRYQSGFWISPHLWAR